MEYRRHSKLTLFFHFLCSCCLTSKFWKRGSKLRCGWMEVKRRYESWGEALTSLSLTKLWTEEEGKKEESFKREREKNIISFSYNYTCIYICTHVYRCIRVDIFYFLYNKTVYQSAITCDDDTDCSIICTNEKQHKIGCTKLAENDHVWLYFQWWF